MWWLIGQIALFVVVAAIIGVVVGWLLRRWWPGLSGTGLSGELTDCRDELAATRQRAEDAEADLARARSETTAALSAGDEAAARTVALEGQLSASRARVASLEIDLEGLRAHDRALADLRSEAETARSERDAARAELATVQPDLAAARQRAAAAAAEAARLTARLAEVQVDLDAARVQRNEARARVEEVEDAIDTLRAGAEGALGEVKALRAAATAREAELQSVRAELARTEAELDSRSGVIAELEARLSSASAPSAEELPAAPGFAPEDVAEAMERAGALGARGARDAVVARFAAGAEQPPDDLKQIKGIGPVLEGLLHGMNVRTFEQVGSFTAEDVAMVSAALESFPDRIIRDRWVEQARELQHRRHRS